MAREQAQALLRLPLRGQASVEFVATAGLVVAAARLKQRDLVLPGPAKAFLLRPPLLCF